MKKVLYSTTILAAAASLALGAQDAQAKGMKIGVGGYMKSMMGFAEQNGSFESTANATTRVGYDSFNLVNDTEVYFRGSTKLDNGMGVSVTIQLESDAPKGGSSIDESYMTLKGGFGQLQLGRQNSVVLKLLYLDLGQV